MLTGSQVIPHMFTSSQVIPHMFTGSQVIPHMFTGSQVIPHMDHRKWKYNLIPHCAERMDRYCDCHRR
jgi:hypothetical protein